MTATTASPASGPATESDCGPEFGVESCSHPSVLCVDDDPYVAAAFTRLFTSLGIDVHSAYSGLQGYWTVVTKRPDIVVADLSMPNGGGVEMIECMRRNRTTANIPIIVLTGHDLLETRAYLQELGVHAYLTKPVSLATLVDRIFEVLPPNRRSAGEEF